MNKSEILPKPENSHAGHNRPREDLEKIPEQIRVKSAQTFFQDIEQNKKIPRAGNGAGKRDAADLQRIHKDKIQSRVNSQTKRRHQSGRPGVLQGVKSRYQDLDPAETKQAERVTGKRRGGDHRRI